MVVEIKSSSFFLDRVDSDSMNESCDQVRYVINENVNFSNQLDFVNHSFLSRARGN